MFIEQLMNGLTLGSIYALVALGYTMVYGVLLMINFAHSEIFMLGSYIGLGALVILGPETGGLLAAFLGAMLLCAFLAIVMERLAYRPLRRASRLAPLISAIGVSIILQNAVFLWRDESMAFPEVLTLRRWSWGGISFNNLQLVIISVALGLMVILHIFVTKTKMGKAIRACAQDRQTAALLGIPVNTIIALTFFVGGALGGAAGVLNGLYYGSIKYNMGFTPGIKAFTAAVLGGIGNIPGAMVGGLCLGILEALGTAFLPQTEWKDVFAFAILIVVLIFRPQGLLGERFTERA